LGMPRLYAQTAAAGAWRLQQTPRSKFGVKSARRLRNDVRRRARH
jgi:hypothetical protein